jgi:acyl carrier protein
LTAAQAHDVIGQTLLEIVPDADLAGLTDDVDYREQLELDSLDFVEFVERLSRRTGCRIDEDDYGELATMGAASAFLAARSGQMRP